MEKLQLNQPYSTKELCEALGIGYKDFRNRKQDYIDSLNAAYEYTTSTKGRTIYYTIIEQRGEFEPPVKKYQKKKNDQTIKKFINEVIDNDPVQTATNINRIAWAPEDTGEPPTEIMLMGLKPSTTNEYIRINLREMYGNKLYEGGTDGQIINKVWCYLAEDETHYEAMTAEQIRDLYSFIDYSSEVQKETDLDIMYDYQFKVIPRDEMYRRLGENRFNIFQMALSNFKMKYHFYPMRVPVYARKVTVKQPTSTNN